MMAMMAGLRKMLAPAMMGMSVGSMVGSSPSGRSASTTCRSHASRHGDARRQHDRRLRRGLGDPRRRDAPVGAHPRAHRARAVLRRRTSATRSPRPGAPARRRLPPRPHALADKLGSLDVEAGNPMEAMQQAFSDPEMLLGAVRSPEQIALAAAARRAVAVVIGYLDWVVDAVVGARRRRQGAAHRRGGPPAALGDHARRHVRRAPARHPARRRPGGARQGVRAGRRRPGRRSGLAPLLERPDAFPTPPRSTPLASGSPASRSAARLPRRSRGSAAAAVARRGG